MLVIPLRPSAWVIVPADGSFVHRQGVGFIWLWVKTRLPGLTTKNEQKGLLRRSTYAGLGICVLTHSHMIKGCLVFFIRPLAREKGKHPALELSRTAPLSHGLNPRSSRDSLHRSSPLGANHPAALRRSRSHQSRTVAGFLSQTRSATGFAG